MITTLRDKIDSLPKPARAALRKRPMTDLEGVGAVAALREIGADDLRAIDTGVPMWGCPGCRLPVEQDMLVDVSEAPEWLREGRDWLCSACLERPYFEGREVEGARVTRRQIREALGDDTSHLPKHVYYDRPAKKSSDRK